MFFHLDIAAIVMVAGAVLYLLGDRVGKFAELGRLAFFAALLALLMRTR
jgi:hypothetical protein